MGKHAKPRGDKCEYPGCPNVARRGDGHFTFVAFAINPKTKEQGMDLCPKHEAEAVKRGY